MPKQETDPAQTANDPTRAAYEEFQTAYEHFNYHLFGGGLPNCLITMQRKSKSYGYFAGDRFGETALHGVGPRDETGRVLPVRMTDEIALNPSHFQARTTEEVLSTLVHEMVHLWQHHDGAKRPSNGYHNKEWAVKMEEIGLVPSDTGAVGGKKTGKAVSHFIHHDGPFKAVCAQLTAKGFTIPYVDLWGDEKATALKKKKAASKTKYLCPGCDLNMWGKPDVVVLCGTCTLPLEAEVRDEEGED